MRMAPLLSRATNPCLLWSVYGKRLTGRLLGAWALLLVGLGVSFLGGGALSNVFEPDPHSDVSLYIIIWLTELTVAVGLGAAAMRLAEARRWESFAVAGAIAGAGFPFSSALDTGLAWVLNGSCCLLALVVLAGSSSPDRQERT